MQQGSPEWHAIRAGRVTASRVADVVAKTKTGYSSSRANYLAELIVERLTGDPAPTFQTEAMRRGSELEPDARVAYEFRTDAIVVEIAFVEHPTIDMTGASPDGLIGDDGLLEIKCPNTAQHVETLLSGDIPGKYLTQMQWQMACTGRRYCDFVSFDPRLPEAMSLFIKRVNRDDKRIAELETEVRAFIAELDAKESELRRRFDRRDAA